MILVYPLYLLFFIVIFRLLKIKPKFTVSMLILFLPWSGFFGSKIAAGYYCGNLDHFIIPVKKGKIFYLDDSIMSYGWINENKLYPYIKKSSWLVEDYFPVIGVKKDTGVDILDIVELDSDSEFFKDGIGLDKKYEYRLKNHENLDYKFDYNITTMEIKFPKIVTNFISGFYLAVIDNKTGQAIAKRPVIKSIYDYPFLNTGTGEFWFQSREACGVNDLFYEKLFNTIKE